MKMILAVCLLSVLIGGTNSIPAFDRMKQIVSNCPYRTTTAPEVVRPGETLTCRARTWTRSPVALHYTWKDLETGEITDGATLAVSKAKTAKLAYRCTATVTVGGRNCSRSTVISTKRRDSPSARSIADSFEVKDFETRDFDTQLYDRPDTLNDQFYDDNFARSISEDLNPVGMINEDTEIDLSLSSEQESTEVEKEYNTLEGMTGDSVEITCANSDASFFFSSPDLEKSIQIASSCKVAAGYEDKYEAILDEGQCRLVLVSATPAQAGEYRCLANGSTDVTLVTLSGAVEQVGKHWCVCCCGRCCNG